MNGEAITNFQYRKKYVIVIFTSIIINGNKFVSLKFNVFLCSVIVFVLSLILLSNILLDGDIGGFCNSTTKCFNLKFCLEDDSVCIECSNGFHEIGGSCIRGNAHLK